MNKINFFFFCYLYPIYLSHYLTYQEIPTFENLQNIYNNKYRDIDITVIAKKSLTDKHFYFYYSIYWIHINFSSCSNTNFMSPISPLYYYQNNTLKYFISPINNLDYISDSSYNFIGLNNERKAIIKFNSKFFHIFKDTIYNKFRAGYVGNNFINFDSSTPIIELNSYNGYYLNKIKNDKLLISLCKVNNNIITIKYLLLNKNVIIELEYSKNPNKINNPGSNSCDKIQTVEIKINENSYIISCYFVINYGVTCISNLIKEKMIISNQERIIGLCNNIITEPNTFTLLSNDTFAMIGCGSEDAKIVKIDENLNEIGNQFYLNIIQQY